MRCYDSSPGKAILLAAGVVFGLIPAGLMVYNRKKRKEADEMNCVRMVFPGGKHRAFTMSYDDGVEQDVRLISTMKKYGVKGTFNLNSGLYAAEGTVYPKGQVHRRMTREMCLKTYDPKICEVAVHGYRHPFWNQLPAGTRMLDIIKDREQLESDFDTVIRGAAYPYGAYDGATIDTLRDAGIVYCRTVNATHSFRIPENWLALDPTCHHNDEKLDELADRFLAATDSREPMLFYLWGHSYEFEGMDNWPRIESFLSKIGANADIWYATNIEVYDYVQAFKQLRFSADGKTVVNPSAMPVWFKDEKLTHMVAGGETYRL